MKFNTKVSSSRRKNRKAHFAAPSHERVKRMSSALSKTLKEEHNLRSLPVRIKDKVLVTKGKFKGMQGNVVKVRRNKYKVYVDCCEVAKNNGQKALVGVDASNLVITELNLEFDRKEIIEKKKEAKKVQAEVLAKKNELIKI